MKNQQLIPRDMESNFLQDYGMIVQCSIEDEEIRGLHPASD